MLSLSTKGRYATRIMIFLARRQERSPASKNEISRAENITEDYIEQILTKLKSAELVKSHRGANGGFSLARDPNRITVADVLAATEGPTDLAPCKKDNCLRAAHCVTRPVWQRASDAINNIFADVTIGDLARQADSSPGGCAVTYDI